MLDPEQLYTLEPRWVEPRQAEQATAPEGPSADRSGAPGELGTEGPVLVHALTGFIDAGIESLRCHGAYLAGLGPKAPDPDRFLRDAAQRYASRFGGRLATPFEVYR